MKKVLVVLAIVAMCGSIAYAGRTDISCSGTVTINASNAALSHMWSFYWGEMPFIYAKMDELNVQISASSWVKQINASDVTCFNIFSGREWAATPDNVILVTTKYSNMEPYKLLKEKGVGHLYLIGDAKAPRQIGEAVRDGHALAREI